MANGISLLKVEMAISSLAGADYIKAVFIERDKQTFEFGC